MFYSNRVVVQAPAKINLSLDITGSTPDGYHSLETVMQSIDLCDVVIITRSADADIQITCSRPDIPADDTNIAHKAALSFFRLSGIPAQGLSIHIDKRIPIQAGLAGGSADAAAVLVGMNRLFETGFDVAGLCEIGGDVGADVPFCIAGGLMFARGKGEILEPLNPLPDCIFAVARPPVTMSTRYAFHLYDDFVGEPARPDTQSLLRHIEAGDAEGIGQNMHNIFEQITLLDEVEMLKGALLSSGALGAVMTGSGSAVVGLFSAERDARKCLHQLRDIAPEAWTARPLPMGANILLAD